MTAHRMKAMVTMESLSTGPFWVPTLSLLDDDVVFVVLGGMA
jgi:hypothetical protein